jgi:hypothetical protein
VSRGNDWALLQAQFNKLQTLINTKAPSANPTFTGNVDVTLVSNSGLVTIETPAGNGFDFAVTDNGTNACIITPIVAGVRQGSNQIYYNPADTQWVVEGNLRVISQIKAVESNFVRGASVTITPVANAATSGNVSWGLTMPSTPFVTASANSTANTVKNVQWSSNTTTGCTVWIIRENTTATTCHAIAVSS